MIETMSSANTAQITKAVRKLCSRTSCDIANSSGEETQNRLHSRAIHPRLEMGGNKCISMASILALVSLMVLLPACLALEFEMQAQVKCIYEEINTNVLVVGDWSAFHRDSPTTPEHVDIRVS